MLRQKSAHSGGKVGFRFAAEKCTLSGKFGGGRSTFRRKGVILLVALCGEKMQFPDAKKCTFRRKGMIFFVRVAAKKCTFIGEFGGEKAHIRKERCDFVESCCD